MSRSRSNSQDKEKKGGEARRGGNEDSGAEEDAPVSSNGYKDEPLNCKDCNGEFVFTSGEQEFYASKGFDNKPARCQKCKDVKKSLFEADRGGSSSSFYSSWGGYGGDREFSDTGSSDGESSDG